MLLLLYGVCVLSVMFRSHGSMQLQPGDPCGSTPLVTAVPLEVWPASVVDSRHKSSKTKSHFGTPSWRDIEWLRLTGVMQMLGVVRSGVFIYYQSVCQTSNA